MVQEVIRQDGLPLFVVKNPWAGLDEDEIRKTVFFARLRGTKTFELQSEAIQKLKHNLTREQLRLDAKVPAASSVNRLPLSIINAKPYLILDEPGEVAEFLARPAIQGLLKSLDSYLSDGFIQFQSHLTVATDRERDVLRPVNFSEGSVDDELFAVKAGDVVYDSSNLGLLGAVSEEIKDRELLYAVFKLIMNLLGVDAFDLEGCNLNDFYSRVIKEDGEADAAPHLLFEKLLHDKDLTAIHRGINATVNSYRVEKRQVLRYFDGDKELESRARQMLEVFYGEDATKPVSRHFQDGEGNAVPDIKVWDYEASGYLLENTTRENNEQHFIFKHTTKPVKRDISVVTTFDFGEQKERLTRESYIFRSSVIDAVTGVEVPSSVKYEATADYLTLSAAGEIGVKYEPERIPGYDVASSGLTEEKLNVEELSSPIELMIATTYTPSERSIKLIFVDDDASGETVKETKLSGHAFEPVNLKLDDLLPQHFEHLRDNRADYTTFPTEDNKNAQITVHLRHSHKVEEFVCSYRVIFENVPYQDVIQLRQYKKDTDLVTGKVDFESADPIQPVNSPDVKGFKLSDDKQKRIVFDLSGEPKDQLVTVHYAAIEIEIPVKLVDLDSAKGDEIVQSELLTGNHNQAVVWPLVVPENYLLEASNLSDVKAFDIDKPQEIVVKLRHKHELTKFDSHFRVTTVGLREPFDFTRTFHCQKDVDLVTRDVVYTSEIPALIDYTAPDVKGYKLLSELTSVHKNLKEQNYDPLDLTLIYEAIPLVKTINVVDSDSADGEVMPLEIRGIHGDEIVFDENKIIPAGFELKSSNKAEFTHFDIDNDEPIDIHLAHKHSYEDAVATFEVKIDGFPGEEGITKRLNYTVDTDLVTKEIKKYADEDVDTTVHFEAPAKLGYRLTNPNLLTIDYDFAAENFRSVNYLLTYEQPEIEIPVSYLDAENDGYLLKEEVLKGVHGAKVAFELSLPEHYALSVSNHENVSKFDIEDPQQITVKLHHEHDIEDLTTTFHISSDGLLDNFDEKKTVKYRRDTDRVTGEVKLSSDDSLIAYHAPEIEGYTLLDKQYANLQFDFADVDFTPLDITVKYQAEEVQIPLVVKDGDKELRELSRYLTGPKFQLVTFDAKAYVPENYKLVSSSMPDAMTYHPDAKPIELVLAHETRVTRLTGKLTVALHGLSDAEDDKPFVKEVKIRETEDLVTGERTRVAADGKESLYVSYDAPVVKGFDITEARELPIAVDFATADKLEQHFDLHYTPAKVVIPVTLRDAEDSGAIIERIQLTGKHGDAVSFDVKAAIPEHYELSGAKVSVPERFDASEPQEINVILRHQKSVKDLETSLTIKFYGMADEVKDKVLTCKYKETRDFVTGKVTKRADSPIVFFDAPKFAGYELVNPLERQIRHDFIQNDYAPAFYSLRYQAIKVSIPLDIYDAEDPDNKEWLYHDVLTGLAGSDVKPTFEIPEHYEIVTSNLKDVKTFEPTGEQAIEIALKHVHVSQKKKAKLQIQLTGLPEEDTRELTLDYTEDIDQLTGETLRQTGKDGAVVEFTAPNITGYQLTDSQQAKIHHDFAASDFKDARISVAYHAMPVRIPIAFVDEDDKNKVVAQSGLIGKHGEKIVFDLEEHLPARAYEVSRSNLEEISAFDAENPQEIKIQLRHRHDITRYAATFKVVHRGLPADTAEDFVATCRVKKDTDLTTGTVKLMPADKDQATTVSYKAPEIHAYELVNPEQAEISYDFEAANFENAVVEVNYKQQLAQVKASLIDLDNNRQTLDTMVLTGFEGEKVVFNPRIPAHYELSGLVPADAMTFSVDKVQEIRAELKHQIETNDLTTTFKATTNGLPKNQTYEQVVKYKKHTDLVTQKATYTAVDDSLVSYKLPEIKGYNYIGKDKEIRVNLADKNFAPISMTLEYRAIPITISYQMIDSEENGKILDGYELTGVHGDGITADVSLPANYTVVSSNRDDVKSFDVEKEQAIRVVVKHQHDLTQAETYFEARLTGLPKAENVRQPLTYTIDKDLVTGKVLKSSDAKTKFTYTAPNQPGYRLIDFQAKRADVDFEANDFKPVIAEFVYEPISASVTVTLLDDDEKGRVVGNIALQGAHGEPVELPELPDGYVPKSSNLKDVKAFDALHPQNLSVHLTHDIKDLTGTADVTLRLLGYPGAETLKRKIEYHLLEDKVTGRRTVAENQEHFSFDAPEIAGYALVNPDKAHIDYDFSDYDDGPLQFVFNYRKLSPDDADEYTDDDDWDDEEADEFEAGYDEFEDEEEAAEVRSDATVEDDKHQKVRLVPRFITEEDDEDDDDWDDEEFDAENEPEILTADSSESEKDLGTPLFDSMLKDYLSKRKEDDNDD